VSRKSEQKYQITIRNWGQYQREMRGGENRKRQRKWVAISVNLFSDPEFFNMDFCHRLAWIGLLCHAGKVGPVFELCPSDVRVMFQLRRSPDFEVFRNQGFIDLEAAQESPYIQDIQDIHKKVATLPKRATKKPPKKYPNVDEVYGLNIEAWNEWIKHRREGNKPVYKTNLKAIELSVLTHEQQLECVRHSIGNEYTGLFPDKFKEGGGPKKQSWNEELAANAASLDEKMKLRVLE
jgi:hypothetical protein